MTLASIEGTTCTHTGLFEPNTCSCSSYFLHFLPSSSHPLPLPVFSLSSSTSSLPPAPFLSPFYSLLLHVPPQVLELLKVAWTRRLIFTVGNSSTTGERDTVVWNEIHHKTEMMSNVSGHGYPDPNYLDNVLSELASQGVTEDCLTKQPGSNQAAPGSGF